MAEPVVNLNLLLVAIVGLTAFGMWLWSITKTSSHQKQLLKDRDEEIKGWKHKFNVIKGQYYRMSNSELIEPEMASKVQKGEVNLADSIPTILNSAAEYLPRGLKDLAKSSQIQGMLKGLAEKYPDEAKSFLSGILPRITKAAGESPQKTVGL